MTLPINDASAAPDTDGGASPSLRVRASRGTLLSAVGQGGTQVLRLGGNLVLAHMLYPEAFGLMAIVYLVVFALDQISNVGIPAAIMRFDRGEEPLFLNTAWTIQLIRGALLWGIGASLAPFVANFYHQPELASILPVATFAAVVMGLTSTKLIVLTRRLQLGRVVVIELSGQMVALVVMVGLAWLYGSVWALVIGGMANQATIALLSHLAIPGPRNRIEWNAEDARAIFSIGKWVFASSGLSFLLAQMDIALLGRLIPAGLLGVYSMGAIIPNLLRDLSFRLSSSILAPIMAESNRHSEEALRARFDMARRLTLPTALLMALAAAVVAPAFFGYLYDDRYEDAGWIAQLALLRFWFAYLQVSGCLTLLSIGDGRTWAISNGAGLVGVTAGCFIGFEIAELPGLIVGMAVGTAVGAMVPMVQLMRRRIGTPAKEILYTSLGAALAAIALGAAHYSAAVVPIEEPYLRTLVVGSIALAPFALWTAYRVRTELRMR